MVPIQESGQLFFDETKEVKLNRTIEIKTERYLEFKETNPVFPGGQLICNFETYSYKHTIPYEATHTFKDGTVITQSGTFEGVFYEGQDKLFFFRLMEDNQTKLE